MRVVTICAHCADSTLLVDIVPERQARYFYCCRPCWAAGPRGYGRDRQDHELRGAPLDASIHKANKGQKSIMFPYAERPLFGAVDSPRGTGL